MYQDLPLRKNEKLHGKFRASDFRWDTIPRTIENIILNPGMPPLYRVSVITKAVFTKNQLQLISNKEELPGKQFIRGKPKVFRVEKILKKKKVGKQIFYKIKWIENDENESTWEPKANLLIDVPELVQKFEDSLKK